MKFILSNSLLSIIFKFFFFIILFLTVILSVINHVYWYIASTTIIIFIISFIFLFNPLFGYLKISRKVIYTSNDLTFKKFRIQHKESIIIDDIIAIEFLEEECASDGGKILWRYTGTPPYLRFIMRDDSIKRIYLGKYSHKTWIKIERWIIKNNGDILILKDAKSFLIFLKTGILH